MDHQNSTGGTLHAGANRAARSSRFSRWVGATLLFSIGYVACGPGDATLSTGTLSMRLSTELSGVTYQLRAATFDVSGPQDTTLTADYSPEATSIQVTLSEGDYQIQLLDGWQLERRLAPASAFEPVEAHLLSPNPTAFGIVDGGITDVAYEFETSGGTVHFGEGNLNLTIRVVDNGATSNQPGGSLDIPPDVSPPDCQDPNVACGLTWLKTGHDMARGQDTVFCHDYLVTPSQDCDPYVGDTSCDDYRPILCIHKDGSSSNGFEPVAYNGWAAGTIDITAPIQGRSLTSPDVADAFCATAFGAGWQMAEHHDGGYPGWGWTAYGNISNLYYNADPSHAPNRRFWVRIDGAPGNCWD